MTIPKAMCWSIETTEDHVRGFAWRHPLEFRNRSIRPLGNGKWMLTGLAGLETFTLENLAVFGDMPVVIDVTSIKRLLANRMIPFTMMRIDLTQEWVDYITETCGVEQAGVDRHDAESVKRPGVMVEWRQFYTTTIDGSHRLCKAWQLGAKSIEFAMVSAQYIINHVCRPGAEAVMFQHAMTLEQVVNAHE